MVHLISIKFTHTLKYLVKILYFTFEIVNNVGLCIYNVHVFYECDSFRSSDSILDNWLWEDSEKRMCKR